MPENRTLGAECAIAAQLRRGVGRSVMIGTIVGIDACCRAPRCPEQPHRAVSMRASLAAGSMCQRLAMLGGRGGHALLRVPAEPAGFFCLMSNKSS